MDSDCKRSLYRHNIHDTNPCKWVIPWVKKSRSQNLCFRSVQQHSGKHYTCITIALIFQSLVNRVEIKHVKTVPNLQCNVYIFNMSMLMISIQNFMVFEKIISCPYHHGRTHCYKQAKIKKYQQASISQCLTHLPRTASSSLWWAKLCIWSCSSCS